MVKIQLLLITCLLGCVLAVATSQTADILNEFHFFLVIYK